MDIYELDSYRLSDAVKFHDELNPALWEGDHMRPEVRDALLKIADDFRTFMGIDDLAVKDITVSGSNAAFSYTPHSDIDLHLIVDFNQLNPDDVYQELFNAKKYQYNDQHDIKIRGYDVELYVQDSNKPVRSLGEYSIIDDDWKRIPVRRRGNLDEKSTQSKYNKLKDLIGLAMASDDLQQVTAVTDTLKKYRQAGLDQHGEFGPENLAYKILRTQGLIDRVFKHKTALDDKKLSLDERRKKKSPKKKFRYGAFGGYYYPGYGYYGQTGSAEAADGGGDGGGESVKESTVNVEKKQIPLDKVARRFVHFASKYLKLEKLPKIRLVSGDLSHNIHSMGHYVDDTHTVEVETKDRHVMDILRTLAHELTHYRQHERLGKKMPASAGRTGSDYENEAHAEAGIIMRHFQNRHPEFFASTVSEDGESVRAQYGDQTPPGPESPPTMPAGTLRVDVSDVYDWYKLGQHISNMKGLGHHDFGSGPPSTIVSFGDEDTEHKFIRDLEATGLDVTDIDPKDPKKRPGRKIKTDPTYNVNEFAPSPGYEPDPEDDVPRYLMQLANLWWNQADPEAQEEVTRELAAGGWTIQQIDDDTVILHHKEYGITYRISDDQFDPDLHEGLGKALATGALAAAAALGQPAQSQAQDAGRVAYQIGKQIYQPSGIFTRAGAEEELRGIARDMARGSREIRVGGKLIYGGPRSQGERVASNAVAASAEEAYRQALENAINRAQQQYGTITLGPEAWKVVDYEADSMGNTFRAMVAIEGPVARKEAIHAPVSKDSKAHDDYYRFLKAKLQAKRPLTRQEQDFLKTYHLKQQMGQKVAEASGYIPTEKQKNDPRFKTALTVDVRPGETGRQANKLGLKTDSRGRPDLLMKNLANALHEFKESGQFILESEQINEVNMSPSALEAWARSPEAEGIRAGFEAEMIFRDTKRDEDEYDQEPDYDYDERPDSIEHVIDFFSNDDYGYGLSPRGARDLRNSLYEEYTEWADEQIGEQWDQDAEDQVRDYMETNVWGDDSEREDRIRNKLSENYSDEEVEAIMAAGDAAPRFTKSSDQQQYVKDNDLYQKYLDASDEAHEEFEEEVTNEFESQGRYYDEAREYYWDMMKDGSDYEEFDFLRDRYGYMTDIANNNSLDWPYWTGGSQGGGDRDWDDIADSLRNVVDMEVKVGSGYHSTTRKDDRWIIEPDGSLDPDDGDDMGLEIVSPPMPLPQALEKLKAVIEWGNSEADAYTNSSTGLHMGVSIPYVGGDVDYVKLVLFMGDEYILDKFGRASNTYAASAMGKLRQNMAGARNRGELTEAKLDPMGALELVQKNLIELAARYVQQGVGTSKYTSAHIKDGYIEFRSPGGDYLSMESRGEYDDIRNTMLRFARAMQIAGSPALERKEYAKKLYKLISPGAQDDGLKLFSQYAAGVISPEQLKKQWADAVLQKEIPTTGKQEYEVYSMDNKNSPDGIVGTFYARDYDSAYDQFLRQYGRDINNLDVRIKQPWFDVYDDKGDVVLTMRASDIDKATDRAQYEFGERWTDDWKVYRRPDNTPEPKNKLSRRAEVAKRIKEPKVTDKVAADNAQDSQQIQARVGEPRPAGSVRNTGYYRVTWDERRNDTVVSDALNVDAENANAAMDRVRNALQAQGRDIIQISADAQEPPAWRQRSQSSGEPIPGSTMDLARQRAAQSSGEFTGAWRVLDRSGEEVYRFSGVGNSQSDANRTAQTWLISQGNDLEDRGPFNVYPVMR